MSGPRLSAAQFAIAYAVVLVAVVALDAVWLGLVAKGLYKREMGSLMSDSVLILPAVLFYLLYPLAVVYLGLFVAPTGWADAMRRSAVLGLAAYGAYNLTNLSILRGWPVSLSLNDWSWGCVATARAGTAGYLATWGRA
jgi:uncharacterized membrane protein